MRRLVVSTVVLAAVVALAVVASRRDAATALPPAATAAVPAAAPLTATPAPPRDVAVDASVLATPEARAYLERADVERRARRFFDDPKAFAPDARAREAQALTAAIDRYEAARQLSAGEAMMLRIGLVRATVDDEIEQTDRVAGIVAAYHADAAQREARFVEAQRNDAAFGQYKAREREIVAEVMALAQIPDGLTREEYLRRRLQDERVALLH